MKTKKKLGLGAKPKKKKNGKGVERWFVTTTGR